MINNEEYRKSLSEYANYKIDWTKFNNKRIMITGATGLIGRYLVDLIMYKNSCDNLNCHIVAISRDAEKAKRILGEYFDSPYFLHLQTDVSEAIKYDGKVDYIIHAASNTHPVLYATNPVGTIKTNVLGTYNLLNFAKENKCHKFLLVSSFEVYGRVDLDKAISENDFGVVDTTILRSCYPESKRLSESLCVAYTNQEKVDTSIVRLSRVFGPTMDMNSSLATAQFIKCGLDNTDIVLKSNGEQLYSYNYVADAVMAILMVLINGAPGEAYNVADSKFDLKLKEFAAFVAEYVNRKVIFDIPKEDEKKGFSNLTMTILDSNKIKDIGWYAPSNIKKRIKETIDILR